MAQELADLGLLGFGLVARAVKHADCFLGVSVLG